MVLPMLAIANAGAEPAAVAGWLRSVFVWVTPSSETSHRSSAFSTPFSCSTVRVCVTAPSSSMSVSRETILPPTPPPSTWSSSSGIVAPPVVFESTWEKRSSLQRSPATTGSVLSNVVTVLL